MVASTTQPEPTPTESQEPELEPELEPAPTDSQEPDPNQESQNPSLNGTPPTNQCVVISSTVAAKRHKLLQLCRRKNGNSIYKRVIDVFLTNQTQYINTSQLLEAMKTKSQRDIAKITSWDGDSMHLVIRDPATNMYRLHHENLDLVETIRNQER